jgi:hypothetical protein
MDREGLECPQCFRMISPEETVVLRDGRPSHLDCLRPRTLSTEERTLLFAYCRDHSVAECSRCSTAYRLSSVVLDYIDYMGTRTNLCQWCQRDLTESIRSHLYGCTMLPAEVRQRAQEARDAARALVKKAQQLQDRADVLIREAEAAIQALQAAMRKLPPKREDG